MRERCELVVASIDDDGYCRTHPADMAMASGDTREDIEGAITVIQSLEPAGIGALNLRERLLIQLDRTGMKDTFTFRIVRDHFDDLAGNRLPSLARKLRVHVRDFHQVLTILRGMKPVLDSRGAERGAERVVEDAVVDEQGEKLVVRVNGDHVPRIRINEKYKRLLTDPTTPEDTKEYVKQKLRSAAYFMYSLGHRQQTLDRIVDEIVQIQNEFFHKGNDYLKPMTMGKVAEAVGVHETTVSRAVSGKFLRCKYGMIPLRRFFTHGYDDAGGKAVSNTVVKSRIRELIEQEDSTHPLSDGQIAISLVEHGFKVARRTVAKYRESLRILPCNQRRQYV
jgi:RNA polymerase sigma-54 factor